VDWSLRLVPPGMSSAISLKKSGCEPITIGCSPERRTGGCFIRRNDIGKQAAAKLVGHVTFD